MLGSQDISIPGPLWPVALARPGRLAGIWPLKVLAETGCLRRPPPARKHATPGRQAGAGYDSK